MPRCLRTFAVVALSALATGQVGQADPSTSTGTAPRAASVDLRVKQEPPPSVQLRHEPFHLARRALMAAQLSAQQDLKQWLERYEPAVREASLALVRFVKDNGSQPGAHLRASTWALDAHLAGPTLPRTFTLVQVGVDGELGEDGALLGRPGLVYGVIVEQDTQGRYRLINDGTGVYSYLLPVGGGRYMFPGGPTTNLEELRTVAESW